MNDLIEKRTPEMIGAEIRMYVDAGRRVTMLCGIEIGRRLTEAKEMLPHGTWLPWLEKETNFSERSAQNYMRVFREYGAAQQSLFGPEANTQALADLPITKALALLAIPEDEREQFAKENHVEEMSKSELEKAIKERDEARKKADDLEQDNVKLRSSNTQLKTLEQAAKDALKKAAAEPEQLRKDLQRKEEELRAAQKEIKELQGKPVEVAVQKDEEAEKKAEALQKEIEALKKQLAMSDASLVRFKEHFEIIQAEFEKMMSELQNIRKEHPEKGEKLITATKALLEKFKGRMQE